jgi:arabinan endo-1,5-alpha-L-arabinosidase
MRNKRAKFVSAAIVALFAATSAVAAGATTSGTADGTGGEGRGNARVANGDSSTRDSSTSGASKFKLADPDTVLTDQGDYITYGTSSAGKKCGGTQHAFKVPMLRHGSGDDVGIADCAVGDALPKKNIGGWADKSGGVWAPGVVKHKGKYLMYYTMSKKGSKQKCIGLARSADASGPFKDGGSRPWACPSSGRWTIDANPYVANGKLYVAYRDDQVTRGIETGVSVVGAGDSGWADKDFSSRRTAITSKDIAWDSARNKGNNHIVENPSMFKVGESWYLAYSANAWDSARYATGIAKCGTKPIPRSKCDPLRNGVKRPYFGFKGKAGLGPWRGLPGNHTGPGGMDVFQAKSGSHRAVFHWYQRSDKKRYPITGTFVWLDGGFAVK